MRPNIPMHYQRPSKKLYGRSLTPHEVRACRQTLRAVADQLGLEETAKRLARTPSTVHQYLKGTSQPSARAWEATKQVARALGLPVVEPPPPTAQKSDSNGLNMAAARRALGGLA